MKRITGILPALFTPMDDTGKVDTEVLGRLVDWLFERGVHGLYVCGSTGEGILLGEEEREEILETVIQAANGRGDVVAHIGAIATDQAVRLARHAEAVEADAISALPPFPFGKGEDGIRTHYGAIAEACALPLYLYNIPSLTGVPMTARTVRQLLEIPTVRGMKFSDHNSVDEARFVGLSDGFDVFHGADNSLLYGLMIGAVGGIGSTYNFMPALYRQLFDAFHAGDFARALELQRFVTRFVVGFLDIGGDACIPLGKQLMSLLGFDCGPACKPHPPVPAEMMDALKRFLDSIGFFEHQAVSALAVSQPTSLDRQSVV